MPLKILVKHSRREGVSLSDRAAHSRILTRRPYPPGVHGPTGRGRMTDYGKQLREKQKAKRVYGLNERQFRNLFREASGKRGNSAEFLVELLERRLDNVVYRAGFAKTRAAARQAVSHGHFEVNGRKVNIPSYRVRAGEVVRVREHKRGKAAWKMLEETLTKKQDAPSWLALDAKGAAAKVTASPKAAEVQTLFDPTLIVEFYSRQ